MEPDCPWSGFAPGTVRFCEERLCAWVVEPSNAWSSFGYILLGVAMAVLALRPRVSVRALAVAAAQFMIGVGSFAFHGTGIFIGEFIDQLGMFMLSGLIFAFALGAWRGLPDRTIIAVYAAVVFFSSVAILVVRPLGIPLFAAEMAIGLLTQLALLRRRPHPRAALFTSGVALFLVSFGIWCTDKFGVLCDPQNHLITGHAIWHVMNAVLIYRLGLFYGRGDDVDG